MSVFSLLAFLPAVLGSYGGCTNGITCRNITANQLEFQCRFAGPSFSVSAFSRERISTPEVVSKGNVMMLHGFPEWSDMYIPLMLQLASVGYDSVACNLRGYSPRASPPDQADYNYMNLVADVFAIAEAVNFTKDGGQFHLVGHDHGGLLGWVSAASDQGKQSLLSYSALSTPHNDAFAKGIYGPGADIQQQIASQYFTMFILNNSATIHNDFWWTNLGKDSGDNISGSFPDEAAFQKSLWWYNGAQDAGLFALPPLMSVQDLIAHGAPTVASLRSVFGGEPNNGSAAEIEIGTIPMPVLFVCGTKDTSILCSLPYAVKTSDYCTGEYTALQVNCGHSVLSCADTDETAKVQAAIIATIVAATPK